MVPSLRRRVVVPIPSALATSDTCQVPSLPQLEHPPVPAAVLVAVDVARHAAPVVLGGKLDHRASATLTDVLTLVLAEPPDGGWDQGIQGDTGSQGDASA